jgi:predicted ATPase
MAALASALEQARAGHGQIVAAVGEAGAGKSRFVYEFKATIPSDCKVLEAYSVSHGKASAWLPVTELLKNYFEIADEDDDNRRSEKVETKVADLDLVLAETLPYILSLLGIASAGAPLAMMDARIKRQRTLDTVKHIIIRESLKQPLVVIFEDLHRIDLETQALLDLLVEGVASARFLMLVNYRPEYRNEWGSKSYYLQLRLDPLGGESAHEMLRALLGEDASLGSLKRLIIEKTQGNPFFIEEIVRALVEQGVLIRKGAASLTKPLTEIRIPPTVHGILASRIDALPAAQKDLLQTLAVIGKDFSLNLVVHITGSPADQLEPMLKDLRTAEFIYEQPVLAGVEYAFKHALTQEVAYNSVLIGRRKLLHERAGAEIESMFVGRLDDHLNQLAYHFRHNNNTEKAIEYLGRAGRQSIQRSANAEAVSDLSAAIELLRKSPDDAKCVEQELPLQLALAQAFIVVKGWAAQEVETAYTRALEICDLLGNRREAFFAIHGLYLMYHVRGLYRPARERAYQLLQRAERASDPTMLLLAHYALGLTSLHTGELLLARKHQEMVLSLYNQEHDASRSFPK